MPTGFDTPLDASRYVEAIQAGRFDFVIRYYRSPHSKWPTLAFSEAKILSSIGLSIVTIWEYQSDDVRSFTRVNGVDEATTAYRQAHALDQPPDSAIYFAVDFDPSQKQVDGEVTAYFQGVAAGFSAAGDGKPAYKVGVYGSGRTCRTLLEAGLADFTWLALSTGWGESKIFKGWSIQQKAGLETLPFDNDADNAVASYGAFTLPNALTKGMLIA